MSYYRGLYWVAAPFAASRHDARAHDGDSASKEGSFVCGAGSWSCREAGCAGRLERAHDSVLEVGFPDRVRGDKKWKSWVRTSFVSCRVVTAHCSPMWSVSATSWSPLLVRRARRSWKWHSTVSCRRA